ncbi:hypothetical protein D9M69_543620 [compost metagenome]
MPVIRMHSLQPLPQASGSILAEQAPQPGRKNQSTLQVQRPALPDRSLPVTLLDAGLQQLEAIVSQAMS